jgi:hypothetical protein
VRFGGVNGCAREERAFHEEATALVDFVAVSVGEDDLIVALHGVERGVSHITFFALAFVTTGANVDDVLF